MKKIIILLAAVVITTAAAAQDQEDRLSLRDYKNYFSMQPFYLFTSTFQMDYERTFGNSGVQVSSGVLLQERDEWNSSFGDIRTTRFGYNVELQYRYYFSYSEPEENYVPPVGLYMAPFFRYNYLQKDGKSTGISNNQGTTTVEFESHENFGTYSGGVLFGLKMLVSQRAILDFYLGGGLRYSGGEGTGFNNNAGILSDYYTGVIPKFGMKIGIAF